MEDIPKEWVLEKQEQFSQGFMIVGVLTGRVSATKTVNYLQEVKEKLGITIIQISEIPFKSPDCSPLDFFGFGYLKQKLFNRKAKTLNGIWKACQEEWNKIDINLTRKVFQSWKKHLRLVSQNSGSHIENTKQIHSKTIRL